MLIELLFKPFFYITTSLLNLLPVSLTFPSSLETTFNHVIDIIFSNLQFLGMFIRLDTIKLLIPLIVFVVNFEFFYRLIMWIIAKIPINVE